MRQHKTHAQPSHHLAARPGIVATAFTAREGGPHGLPTNDQHRPQPMSVRRLARAAGYILATHRSSLFPRQRPRTLGLGPFPAGMVGLSLGDDRGRREPAVPRSPVVWRPTCGRSDGNATARDHLGAARSLPPSRMADFELTSDAALANRLGSDGADAGGRTRWMEPGRRSHRSLSTAGRSSRSPVQGSPPMSGQPAHRGRRERPRPRLFALRRSVGRASAGEAARWGAGGVRSSGSDPVAPRPAPHRPPRPLAAGHATTRKP
jgi:hypothetical protein